jgi:hypothetical protein
MTEGAITAVKRALVFDPTLQWDYVNSLGYAYYLTGRYEDAVTVLEPIAGNGSGYVMYAMLAAGYAELGLTIEAERAARQVKRLWPFFTIASFVENWKDRKSRNLVADGLRKAGLK